MKNKKIINKKFAINTTWILIGRAFQMILTFITTMLVSRYLGPAKYGIMNLAYSYVTLFLPFCTLGMNDIVVKQLIDNKNKEGEIIGSILVLRFVSSLLSIGFIFIIVNIISTNKVFIEVAILQSLSLIFQIFDTIVYFYQSKLQANKSGLLYVVAYSISSIFRIICLITKKDIKCFAFSVSLDYLLISTLLLFTYIKDGYTISFSKKIAIELLQKSKPYIFSGIMVVIYSKIDTIIIGEMINEANVGYYSAATTLCNAWPIVLIAIIDSASPIIINENTKNKENYRKKIKQLYAVVFYVGLIVALLITILSKQIINLLYGLDYILAAKPLRIVCWSTIFSYLGVARTPWMQCENKLKYEALLSFAGAVINVLLNMVFIKSYGIVGAAIALVLTQLLTNVVFLYIIKDTRENAKLILEAIVLKNILR